MTDKKQPNITLQTRVQNIYYQKPDDELGITAATSDKRISIAEARQILADRDIDFSDILKVKYETIDLELPLDELQNFTI